MPDEEVHINCPACDALIPFSEIGEVAGADDMSCCPECGEVTPTDEWFT